MWATSSRRLALAGVLTVVVLDTHVLIHDALAPKRVSRRAKRVLQSQPLACSDISLWEISMLITKGRLSVDADTEQFLEDILRARNVAVLPITPKIAALSQSKEFVRTDPADRIITATAIAHGASLLSADNVLRRLNLVKVLW